MTEFQSLGRGYWGIYKTQLLSLQIPYTEHFHVLFVKVDFRLLTKSKLECSNKVSDPVSNILLLCPIFIYLEIDDRPIFLYSSICCYKIMHMQINRFYSWFTRLVMRSSTHNSCIMSSAALDKPSIV